MAQIIMDEWTMEEHMWYRHASGETLASIAKVYGVCWQAVWWRVQKHQQTLHIKAPEIFSPPVPSFE